MRTRVILAKGSNLGQEITLAPFERIDADHIVVGIALRLPQLLPHDQSLDEVFKHWEDVRTFSVKFVEHLRQIEEDYRILAEYVMVAEERGWDNIRISEGYALNIPWFYSTVKSLHKAKNQGIIEVTIHTDGVWIENKYHEREEGINILTQERTSLG